MFRNTSFPLTIVVAAFLIGASGAVANLTLDGSQQIVPPVSAERSAAELGPTLSVFKRPQTSDERLSGLDAKAQAEQMDGNADLGENLGLLRLGRASQWSDDVAIWPADGGPCMAVRGGSVCVPIEALQRQDVSALVVSNPGLPVGTVRVAGLARDGIAEVAIVTADRRIVVPVVDNAFVTDAKEPIEAIAWADDTGTANRLDLLRADERAESQGEIRIESAP